MRQYRYLVVLIFKTDELKLLPSVLPDFMETDSSRIKNLVLFRKWFTLHLTVLGSGVNNDICC